MGIGDALILGIVEGVTEYLPVSSTGHLIVAQRALGIPADEASSAYAIAIQSGAILAVFVLYGRRVLSVARGLAGGDPAGRRLGFCLAAAFLPAAVVGLLLDDLIESVLFGIWPVVAAWFTGGVIILALGRWWTRDGGAALEDLGWRGAAWVGLAQCLAMWPGTSRSLVTILGGLLVGLSLPAAVEFSFLLGLVTLSAATAYDGLRHGEEMVASYGWGAILAGMVAAFASAVAAVRWMVGWLTKHGLSVFGWWRIAGAAIAGGLALVGWF